MTARSLNRRLIALFAFGLSTMSLTGCGDDTATFADGEKLILGQQQRAESFHGDASPDRKPEATRR